MLLAFHGSLIFHVIIWNLLPTLYLLLNISCACHYHFKIIFDWSAGHSPVYWKQTGLQYHAFTFETFLPRILKYERNHLNICLQWGNLITFKTLTVNISFSWTINDLLTWDHFKLPDTINLYLPMDALWCSSWSLCFKWLPQMSHVV